MTWEELKEKAKEMGYRTDERFVMRDKYNKNKNVYSMTFFEDGDVMIGSVCLNDVSYDKMLMIMRGLE